MTNFTKMEGLLINPYTPGAGTVPMFLAGRDVQLAVVDSLASRVESGRESNPIVFVGLRGMGKTSLLRTIQGQLMERQWIAGYFEMRRNVEPGEAIRAIVRNSAELPTGSLAKAMKSGAVRFGGAKLSLGPAGVSFELDANSSSAVTDPYGELVSFLRALGKHASKNRVGVALILDELQVTRKIDLAILFQALSAVKDEPIVLIGAGLPFLAADLAKATTYVERFRFELVAGLGSADAAEAVKAPATEAGVTWSLQALRRVVELGNGYPYFLQLYASETWELAVEKTSLTLADVERAVPSVERQLDSGLYSARFNRLSEVEREYVENMAWLLAPDSLCAGGGTGSATRVRSGRVAEAMGKPLSELSVVRDRVIRKGVIHSPAHGLIEFSVPGFDAYVRRVSERLIGSIERLESGQGTVHDLSE